MVAGVRNLLGLRPYDKRLSGYLQSLSVLVPDKLDATIPEIKSYPDAVYFNYYSLGLSFLFTPQNGYRPKMGLNREELQEKDLILDGIDIYNTPKLEQPDKHAASRSAELAFTTFVKYPILLESASKANDAAPPRSSKLEVLPQTTGKDFVQCLGEPNRKGGGVGPSSGSISIWCEWSMDGIMVEFGGSDARGPHAWERGKDAIWRVISIFPPKVA